MTIGPPNPLCRTLLRSNLEPRSYMYLRKRWILLNRLLSSMAVCYIFHIFTPHNRTYRVDHCWKLFFRLGQLTCIVYTNSACSSNTSITHTNTQAHPLFLPQEICTEIQAAGHMIFSSSPIYRPIAPFRTQICTEKNSIEIFFVNEQKKK